MAEPLERSFASGRLAAHSAAAYSGVRHYRPVRLCAWSGVFGRSFGLRPAKGLSVRPFLAAARCRPVGRTIRLRIIRLCPLFGDQAPFAPCLLAHARALRASDFVDILLNVSWLLQGADSRSAAALAIARISLRSRHCRAGGAILTAPQPCLLLSRLANFVKLGELPHFVG